MLARRKLISARKKLTSGRREFVSAWRKFIPARREFVSASMKLIPAKRSSFLSQEEVNFSQEEFITAGESS